MKTPLFSTLLVYSVITSIILLMGCEDISNNLEIEKLSNDSENSLIDSTEIQDQTVFYGTEDSTSIVLLNTFFGGSTFQWDFKDKDEYFNYLDNFENIELSKTDFPIEILNQFIEDDYIDDYRVSNLDIDNDGAKNTVIAFLDTFYENLTLIVVDNEVLTISGFPFKLNNNKSKHTFVSTPIIECTYYILFDAEFLDASVKYDDYITIVSSNIVLTNDLLKTPKDTVFNGTIQLYDSPENYKQINSCNGCEEYGGNIMTSFSHKNLACKVFGTYIIGNEEWALVLTDKFKTSFVNECTFSESFFPFTKILGWIRIK